MHRNCPSLRSSDGSPARRTLTLESVLLAFAALMTHDGLTRPPIRESASQYVRWGARRGVAPCARRHRLLARSRSLCSLLPLDRAAIE